MNLPTALPAATSTAQTTAAPATSAFGLRILVGLCGVLVASLAAGLNERVTDVGLVDLRGAMGIGFDDGTWLTSLYSGFQVAAMVFAPWCAVTFSLRRFTLWAIVGFTLIALLCPFAPGLGSLYALRAIQGLLGGCVSPMLMTVALRFLPPGIRLYGLGAYALTSTFAPNLGIPLAAVWFEYVGWQFIFWQVIPFCLLSLVAVAWGIPQDPLRLERLRQFDWFGLLTGFPGICLLVIALLQGERLDWLESPMIQTLLLTSAGLLIAFLLNEATHPLPFLKLDMLKRRNLWHALLTLCGVVLISGANLAIPAEYLARVQGYRPLEMAPLALMIALPQLLVIPLVAALCNRPGVDSRWILALGLALLSLSCFAGSQITSQWTRENFYWLFALQAIGQPLAVVPILLQATSTVAPAEGPFASAMINSLRGFASVLSGAFLAVLGSHRQSFHLNLLMDQTGNAGQAIQLTMSRLAESPAATLQDLGRESLVQATVLVAADKYRVLAWFVVALILLLPLVPKRVYPPRSAPPVPSQVPQHVQ
ncbi:MFS transporter [Pseudomonas akapageensis]|uniref:MFS transporter n=1 Tax=Pseudomonas akapageensis TaxID=2609961 RepID=UPI00140CFC2D|nr:MFS transporter [Pseudomonas akapageensis]